jgi:hypothetical protein
MKILLLSGPISNLRLKEEGDQFYPGEPITVLAESNPAPDFYRWVDNTTDEVIFEGASADSIEVDGGWLDPGTKDIRVTVQNTMVGDVKSEESLVFTITVYSELSSRYTPCSAAKWPGGHELGPWQRWGTGVCVELY